MRKTIQSKLFLASSMLGILIPAVSWSAGGDGIVSEALCASPPAGVTCKCSEPLTVNDGTHTTQFNPSGSSGVGAKECNGGTALVGMNGSDAPKGNFASPAAQLADTTQLSEALPNAPFVFRSDVSGRTRSSSMGSWQIRDQNTDFTNGTWCERVYVAWGKGWNCNGNCNIKTARHHDIVDGAHPGMQTFIGNGGYGGNDSISWKLRAFYSGASYFGQAINIIRNPAGSGGTDLSWENDLQGHWVRLEVCYDHNPPGYPNQLQMRVKQTLITGPKAGLVQYNGPNQSRSAYPSAHTGSTTWLFQTNSSPENGTVNDVGSTYMSYAMAATKYPADPTWWIGPALEVEGSTIGSTSSNPSGNPTPTPTPTPTALQTATPTATPTALIAPTPTAILTATPSPAPSATVTFVDDVGCPDATNPNPSVLYCDDFDDGIPIFEKWNAYNPGNDSYVPIAGVGIAGSTAMRASWAPGQVNAGTFSIGLGQLPTFYLGDPNGEDWQHVISPTSKFREIYFRQYLKMGAGWSGIPRKYSRVRVLSDPQPGDGPHPTAFQGHFWQQINTNNGGTIGALYWNNSNGVDESGTVIDTGNNSNTSVWIAQTRGSTAIFQDYPQGSEWICVEAHLKLNDPGLANGIEEFWINDQLEASRTDQNHIGTYTDYGLNQVVFDNYWNEGSPQYNELYRDNIVISTERIGCLPESALAGTGAESPWKPGSPYVPVQ